MLMSVLYLSSICTVPVVVRRHLNKIPFSNSLAIKDNQKRAGASLLLFLAPSANSRIIIFLDKEIGIIIFLDEEIRPATDAIQRSSFPDLQHESKV